MTLFGRFIKQDLLLECEAGDGWRPAAINAVDEDDARFAEGIIRHDGSLLAFPPTQVDQLIHARLEAVRVLGNVGQVLLAHDDAHAASCKTKLRCFGESRGEMGCFGCMIGTSMVYTDPQS